MKRFSSNEKAAFAVSGVMFLLFVSVAVLAGVLFSMLETAERDYADYRADVEIELSELEKQKNENGTSLHDLRNKLELAEKTRAELERRIGQTEAELKKLQSSFENKDQLYGELNAQLADLQKTLIEKQTEIDSLKVDIRELEEVYSVNLNRQMEILAELEILLTEGAPMNEVETPMMNANGTPVLDENGLPKTEVTYEYPRLAIYYEDLGRGYKYAFNGDEAFNSASCVKAPFALSVLMAASEEKAEYERRLAEYIAQNGPVDALPGYVWQYDFDQIFT
ncbi:MAG: hypothetical protein IJD10_07415, partial [Clostridia bacterium]|nr:hypothetical protein [Clostridia bacterium]